MRSHTGSEQVRTTRQRAVDATLQCGSGVRRGRRRRRQQQQGCSSPGNLYTCPTSHHDVWLLQRAGSSTGEAARNQNGGQQVPAALSAPFTRCTDVARPIRAIDAATRFPLHAGAAGGKLWRPVQQAAQ